MSAAETEMDLKPVFEREDETTIPPSHLLHNCSLCPYSTISDHILKNIHLPCHQRSAIYKCNKCTFNHDCQKLMKRHVGLHGKNLEQEFAASCGYRKTSLGKSILEKIADPSQKQTRKFSFVDRKGGKRKCSYCGLSLKYPLHKMDVHLERHREKREGNSTCKYCSFNSSLNVTMLHQSAHQRYLQKAHAVRCEYCNFACDSQMAMTSHLLVGLHKENLGRQTTFLEKNSAKVTQKHAPTPLPTKCVPDKPTTKGPCSHPFPEPTKLTSLRMDRMPKGPAACLVCGLTVSSNLKCMQNHNDRHVDRHGKTCKYCSYSTGPGKHEWAHKRLLDNSHPYRCQYCNFVCDFEYLMDSHRKLKLHDEESRAVHVDELSAIPSTSRQEDVTTAAGLDNQLTPDSPTSTVAAEVDTESTDSQQCEIKVQEPFICDSKFELRSADKVSNFLPGVQSADTGVTETTATDRAHPLVSPNNRTSPSATSIASETVIPVQCMICKITFLSSIALRQHIASRHQQNEISCEPSTSQNFQCSFCRLSCNDQMFMVNHIITEHQNIVQSIDSMFPHFKCPFCPFTVNLRNFLINHIVIDHANNNVQQLLQQIAVLPPPQAVQRPDCFAVGRPGQMVPDRHGQVLPDQQQMPGQQNMGRQFHTPPADPENDHDVIFLD